MITRHHFATTIETARLSLIPATVTHVSAELTSNDSFSRVILAHVPESWPPGEYDRDAQQFFLRSLTDGGDAAVGWFGWYAVTREFSGERATVIGCGGYFGPPKKGVVEIGYSICPEWQQKGFATEMTRGLIGHVLQHANVSRIIAHTHDHNAASIGVLTNSGFVIADISDQPDALLFEFQPPTATQ